MCHFLTIAVPRKTVPDVPNAFRRTIRFDEQANPSVTEHVPRDWICFTATSGGCSCDFYRVAIEPWDSTLRRRKKYEKKGWSDAKVQRALGCHKETTLRPTGLREDIFELVSCLTNALGESRLGLHWYNGNVETEEFSLEDLGEISLIDLKRNPDLFQPETILGLRADL